MASSTNTLEKTIGNAISGKRSRVATKTLFQDWAEKMPGPCLAASHTRPFSC
jgi:hypothetical protein